MKRKTAIRGSALKKVGMVKMTGMRRGGMKGENIFSDIGNFFTRTIPSAATTVYNKALKPAANWVKDQKIISKGLSAVSALDPTGRVAVAGKLADAAGLGRKRRRGGKKTMRGAGAVRF